MKRGAVGLCAVGLSMMAGLACTAPCAGQAQSASQTETDLDVDSGWIANPTRTTQTIFSTVVTIPHVTWVRLQFHEVTLGTDRRGGETKLRLTSLADGAEQWMTSEHLAQWQNTSAYFNGDAVRIELIAPPAAGPSRVVVNGGFGGVPDLSITDSICGMTDDRVVTTDPRVARRFPYGCTAWLIDDANHCFLTAGHCANAMQVVEFNVPLSTASGTPLHPGPQDQYVVDPASMQTNFGVGGPGDDWAYFGCFPNSNTGLTPYEAQGAYFELATFIPFAQTQPLRVTGYGATQAPVPGQNNWALKTHAGAYILRSGTLLEYQADTTGGNSGSPVTDDASGLALAIHTHGGCGSGGNAGTSVQHPALQAALANPQGVCAATACPEDLDDSGAVGFRDLLLVLGAWGPCVGCDEDLDNSGGIGLGDLLAVIEAWGPCD